MVKVRDDKPIKEDGSVDLQLWLANLKVLALHSNFDDDLLISACEFSRKAEEKDKGSKNVWNLRTSSFLIGLEMADILAELSLDQESIIAAILYRTVREGKTSLEQVNKKFGNEISGLIDGVLKMAAISELKNVAMEVSVLGQNNDQSENLRKMLVAMVDDVRVALIKIAERTCAIREVKEAEESRKQKVAKEVFDIYAPLAHRLGIGQLKWELEDLSFRYLEPTAYKQIANLLDGKRLDRQQYIDQVLEQLNAQLSETKIKAETFGRAKHIYSIWRKMKKKGIDFSEVYDVRALRILTQSVQDCYMAIGIVHSIWQPIPGEFDDYIATPKENGYRSLHTAVIGPGGKILEIQIRTYEMHEEAELGICAHWRYKEGSKTDQQSAYQSGYEDKQSGYEDKIAWLRQVIEWQEELGEDVLGTIADQFSHAIIDERIYVFTPEGHVVDIPSGATPVDFAYHVHTEIGHSCRGAKVNGKMVPLSYKLKTGEQVEIIRGKNARPSRDWLNNELGFLNTARARAKAKHWFKLLDRDENIIDGKLILKREFQRLALGYIDINKLAQDVNLKSGDDIFAAVGAGDLRVSQVLNAIQSNLKIEENKPQLDIEQLEFPTIPYPNAGPSSINVQGVDNILTQIARCCKPVPGDVVVGYITVGRGVTIHRGDCIKLVELIENEPNRIVEIDWNATSEKYYPVEVLIRAYDRQGLLRDITELLANEKINLTGVQTRSDGGNNIADLTITMRVNSLDKLSRVLSKVSQMPNVFDVQRYQS
jgi:GTP pyrophosphokinase